MSEICSKRGCDHPKFGNDKYCILHCDKKDFDDNQRNTFWSELREEYPKRYNEELIIKDINFPKFQENYYGGLYFYNMNFSESVKLVNCEFFDDFDASSDRFNQGIVFEKCTFHRNIKFNYSNFIELDNCEFKNEFSFENIDCRSLEIRDTKFIKECLIKLQYPILIDENSIFRDKTYLVGTGSNELVCNNSQFDKELEINNINKIEIDNITLKSNVKFLQSTSVVTVNNTTFPKDLSFEWVNNLTFDEVTTNDMKFHMLENLEINSSDIFGSLGFVNSLQKLVINQSNIFTEINTSHIKNIEIIDSKFKNSVTLSGDQNNVNISGSEFKKFSLSASNITNIISSNFSNVELLGDQYSKIDCKKVNIETSLQVNNFEGMILENIQIQSFKSQGEKCGICSLDNFKVKELIFDAKEYESISLIRGSWISDINFHSNIIHKIEFEKVKINVLKSVISMNKKLSLSLSSIKKLFIENTSNELIQITECDISQYVDINLKDSKNIIFDKLTSNPTIKLNTEKYLDIQVIESDLEDLFINAFNIIEKQENVMGPEKTKIEKSSVQNKCLILNSGTINISESRFNNIFNSSSISSSLNIKKSFFDKVDFMSSKINSCHIDSSVFYGDVLCNFSRINSVKITGINSSSEFNGIVDFEGSQNTLIEISNSLFNEINFKNNGGFIFSKIENVQVVLLSFCNNSVLNLFTEAKELKIDELLLDNVELKTSNKSNISDLNLDKINVESFTCKKLVIKQDTNLDNMQISKLRISNSNIEKVFRIRYSEIEEMFFIDTTFEDLQIIDNKNDSQNEKRGLRLKNTTIKSTVLDKLKLDNFNMSDAHVSDAKIGYVKFEQGSRETNRFFKNYYDSISDYIKANSYYKDEMEEQFKTTKRYGSEWWILLFNKVLSNFGQDWVRPLLLILVVTLAIFTTINFDNFIKEGYILNNKLLIWNSYWEFLNPFSKTANEKYKDVYWLWMSHKLLLTVFIYHFIVAIKRKTKR